MSISGKTSGDLAKCWLLLLLLFFFSLFNVKNNFDTQLEYVDLRDWVKQARNTRQKKKIWSETTPTVFPFSLVR